MKGSRIKFFIGETMQHFPIMQKKKLAVSLFLCKKNLLMLHKTDWSHIWAQVADAVTTNWGESRNNANMAVHKWHQINSLYWAKAWQRPMSWSLVSDGTELTVQMEVLPLAAEGTFLSLLVVASFENFSIQYSWVITFTYAKHWHWTRTITSTRMLFKQCVVSVTATSNQEMLYF